MDTGKKQRITFTLSDDVIKFLRANQPAAQTLEKIVRDYAQSLERAAAVAEKLREHVGRTLCGKHGSSVRRRL